MLEKSVSRIDSAVTSIMVPKGLVTAVLASLIMQSGVPGGAVLQNTIYSVILFSIILATLLSFFIEKGWAIPAVNFLFKRHREVYPDAIPAPIVKKIEIGHQQKHLIAKDR